ncbi:MAG TPA: DUF11 domain-containing protein [bacterium]|nr:DUF11 domain-containing protein [bacterium]
MPSKSIQVNAFCLHTAAILLFLLLAAASAQHPDNLIKYVKINQLADIGVDSFPDSSNRHTVLYTLTEPQLAPGRYRIWARSTYSGDSQPNEHIFSTVRTADSLRTPFDNNLGPLKILRDTLETAATIWRDAGAFFLSPDTNIIQMHHYNALFKDVSFQKLVEDVDPAKLMEIVVGDSIGIKQSVHFDSLKILACPSFKLLTDVLKTDYFFDNDGSTTLTAGDEIEYTVWIKNSGSGIAHNVTYLDTLAAELSFIDGSATTSKGSVVHSNGIIQANIGDVDAFENELIIIKFKVRVNQHAKIIGNQGFVFSDETAPHPTDDPDTDAPDDPTFTRLPDFSDSANITKQDTFTDIDNDGKITPGDKIDYLITIRNSGSGVAKNVVFTDTIPQFTELVENSVSTTKGTIISTSPVLNIHIGDVEPDEIEIVSIQFQVVVTDSADMIANQGFVSGDNFPEYPTDDPDTETPNDETRTVLPDFSGAADLLKRGVFVDTDQNGLISPEDSIFYHITIKNSGPGIAHNVVFSDSIPQNTSFVEGSAFTSKGNIVSTSPVFSVDIGTVAARNAELVDVRFSVLVTQSADSIANQGSLISDETPAQPTDDPDTEPADDATVIRLAHFGGENDFLKTDQFIDADGSGSLTAGDFIQYTIMLTNSGRGVAINVVFTDTIPQFTNYVEGSAATSKGNIVSTSPVLRVEIDSIAPNSSETVSISFRVQLTAAVSQIGNQGWVRSPDSGIEPTDDPDTDAPDDPTFTRLPSFSGKHDIIKTSSFEDLDNSKTLSPGDVINYTIVIQNSGKGVAHQVTFTDTIPNYTVYVEGSISATKGVVESSSPVVKIIIGDIAPNRSERITIAFQVELTHAVKQIANQGFINSDQTPDQPTDDPETEPKHDPTIVDDSRFYTKLGIRQFVKTDSFIVSGNDTIHFADESDIYRVFVLIENTGDLSASSIVLECTFPDSTEPLNMVPDYQKIHGDTIFWQIDSLAASQQMVFQYDARLSSQMPEGENLLIHSATVRCANEDPSNLFDNSAMDSVWNVVLPLLFPQIQADPSSVDVTDSIQIRIQIPQYKTDYDLWIYLPDGHIEKQFADHFWQTTSIQPDIWYDIPLKYYPGRLTTENAEEELIFEIRTFDRKNREAHARTAVVVHSTNYLVLDRNVFRPNIDHTLGISFKLSYQRTAKLDIYDLSGKHITSITEDNYQGGWNTYHWDGISANGQLIGSGVYIVTLRSGEFKDWKKFIIIR